MKTNDQWRSEVAASFARCHRRLPGSLRRRAAAALRAFRTSLARGGLVALFACALTAAHAQQDAGQILRQIQGAPTAPKLPEAEMNNQLPAFRPELSDVPELKMDIRGFTLSGVPDDERAAILDQLKRFIGEEKTFQDLLDAAATVKSHLNARGYLLAQAYIPEQKLQGGVVEIVVLLGRLGRIELNHDEATPVARSRIQAHLDRLQPGQTLRTADLERVLFLINDLHGVRASSTIRPGLDPGTADLIVDVQPDPTLSGQVQVDNMGSRYTGTVRVSGNLVVGSPLGLGDSLSLRAMHGQDQGIRFGSLSYVVPLGSDGLRLGATVSRLKYTLLTKEGIPPGYGTALDALAFVLYPIARSRNFNLFVQVGYDYKEFEDNPDAAARIDRRSRSTLLTLSGDLRDSLLGGGINSFSLGYTYGTLENQNATVGTPVGHFRKLNPYYSRLHALGDSGFLVFLRYSGQFTRDRLDSSEKFSLGGPGGVRAFAVGEAPGDEAHLASLELRYALPNWDGKIPGSLVGSVFLDWGRSTLDKNPALRVTDPENTRTLSGYGIGLNWATAKSWSAQGSIAWRDKGDLVNDKLDRRPRAYVQISRYF
ncbi:MAG: ShlB/FhaC/HecB family hemolysin secretion/activation protein [Candidatus Accumulibacter sp.]|uniref:ShlB/FhaC/HecB family hemolysin secretion/activation protein n=1 Tax=Accumulibacter sp. TaxID=2053492 RepID=UPI00287A0EAA|nr:ShlB/FhaC/HecB family hemolysin secretion/activation protein [Accumulibacter sp.]MDS4014055.1 ShlB/FhaC/HecB family hemolysin secretion/activation protein [Accumulibacter sp.]